MGISRQEGVILVLVMLSACIVYIINLGSFQVGVYMDDAEYIVLARGLLGRSWVLGYSKDTLPSLFWQSTTFNHSSSETIYAV